MNWSARPGSTASAASKIQHRGQVWGVYVTDRARGAGIGRMLMAALLARAATIDGIEQIMLGCDDDEGRRREAVPVARVSTVRTGAPRVEDRRAVL